MNRPKRRSAPGSPEQWLDFAESDLALARLASQMESVRAEHVCFHAQQAAEKAIKAVLRARGLEFPLTHDLELLLELAQGAGMELPGQVKAAAALTPYAVGTRVLSMALAALTAAHPLCGRDTVSRLSRRHRRDRSSRGLARGGRGNGLGAANAQ